MEATASTDCSEVTTSVHRLTIAGYSLNRGTRRHIVSKTFTVGGHDWAISYYPDGFYGNGRGPNASVFLHLQSDNGQDVRASYYFSLQDYHVVGREVQAQSVAYILVLRQQVALWLFEVRGQANLGASGCLKDDRLVVKCTVSVVTSELVDEEETCSAVPPSDLDRHIGRLLTSAMGADATLQVRGKSFRAHRCVLAARSPVFRAQLYGEMEDTKGSIAIEDMDVRVFEALLHFMYNDSLPEFVDNAAEHADMVQHLLVAADQYGVERLKVMCEDKLSKSMDVGTAAATLALAEQHHCRHLKASCLKYITADRDTLRAIVKSDGFKNLSRSFPEVVEEIVAKVADESVIVQAP